MASTNDHGTCAQHPEAPMVAVASEGRATAAEEGAVVVPFHYVITLAWESRHARGQGTREGRYGVTVGETRSEVYAELFRTSVREMQAGTTDPTIRAAIEHANVVFFSLERETLI